MLANYFLFLVSLKEFEARKPKIVSLLKSRQHWVAVNKSKQFKKNIGLIQKYLLYNLNRHRIDRIINNQFILFFKFIVKDVSLSFIHDKQIFI